MHTFFATNNFGGGGTNVSRFPIYLESLNTQNIGVLLNYYYLETSFKKSMAFDQPLLRTISAHKSIRNFVTNIRTKSIEKGCVSASSQIGSKDNIAEYILDSGSGNILRDLIKNNTFTKSSISIISESYHKFAEDLNFDLVVALDYALKYTHKQSEGEDIAYKELANQLVANEVENLKILEVTLEAIRKYKYKHKTLAALHGFDFESFNKYQNDVLNLEKQIGETFHGFALGGIADTKKLKNELWKVPKGLNQDEKGIWIVSKLSKNASQLSGNRQLHILGAGNIKAIPFLTLMGATSSDCHSAWRRANDGKAQILVPLFDEQLNFINNKKALDYVKLGEISKYNFIKCDGFSVEEIVKLYNSDNKEDFYYAKILLFIYALYQYDYLIKFIQKNPKKYINLLMNTPDKTFNESYKKIFDLLN